MSLCFYIHILEKFSTISLAIIDLIKSSDQTGLQTPNFKLQASIVYNETKNLLILQQEQVFERKIAKYINFGFHTAKH